MKEEFRKFKDGYYYKSGKNQVLRYVEPIYISNYGNIRGRDVDKSAKYYRFLYKKKKYNIHKEEAKLFPELIPNPNPELYTEVDHIDTNRYNNHWSNLKWCTRIGNMNNPITRKHLSNGNNPNAKRVYDDISGRIFNSVKEYAEYIHRNIEVVRRWLKGYRKFPDGIKAHYIGGHI